jgi:hypothetical protein
VQEHEPGPVRVSRLTAALLMSLFVLSVAPFLRAQSEVALYNERNLTGWYLNGFGGSWYADGPILRADGQGTPLLGDLVSDDTYDDFVLRLDWRVPMQPTDSEMRIHATVGSALAGTVAHTESRRSLARLVVTPPFTTDPPDYRWHQTALTLRGDRLSIEMDGRVAARDVDRSDLPRRGPILIAHNGRRLEFANLRITRLP